MLNELVESSQLTLVSLRVRSHVALLSKAFANRLMHQPQAEPNPDAWLLTQIISGELGRRLSGYGLIPCQAYVIPYPAGASVTITLADDDIDPTHANPMPEEVLYFLEAVAHLCSRPHFDWAFMVQRNAYLVRHGGIQPMGGSTSSGSDSY